MMQQGSPESSQQKPRGKGASSAGILLLSGRSSLVCRGVRVRIRAHPTRERTPLIEVIDGSSEAEADDGRVYCWCQMGSYGDMIACDDPECEREWFHLGCIGLEMAPEGVWFCEACRTKPKNRRKIARAVRNWSGPVHGQLEGPSMPVAPMAVDPAAGSGSGTLMDVVDSDELGGESDDDSERVYCWCQMGSFGDMVACDDNECEREWFHLGCIGLEVAPEGVWFCEACRTKPKNRRKVARARAARLEARTLVRYVRPPQT